MPSGNHLTLKQPEHQPSSEVLVENCVVMLEGNNKREHDYFIAHRDIECFLVMSIRILQ